MKAEMSMGSLPIARWREIVGEQYISVDFGALRAAETATFATTERLRVILRPASLDQAVECVKVANRFLSPLYPVSSGKNWGYGSRVPPRGLCALLDLSRMNRILDFDEDLGYVTVEPGVTQRQLYRFLRERNSELWMDATGSSPDCSLIGNAMERGFGHTPYGDHIEHVCGFQVILASGDVIQTGYARFEGSKTAPLGRWGIGPSFDGLFSQSNFGIVAKMSIHLMPAPETFEAFFFRLTGPEGLEALIDALRRLRMSNSLRSAIHIANDYKVLAGMQQYPWEEAGGKTPLTPDTMASIRNRTGIAFWSASGGIYGSSDQVRAAKKELKRALSRVPGKLQFLNLETLKRAERFGKIFRLVKGVDIKRMAELIQPVIGLMRGVPTEQPLSSAYWRKRMPVPQEPNPDRDRCGLLWYAPMAPAVGRQVEELASMSTSILSENGFEPQISLTIISPRMVACVIAITYDRDLEGEDEKAEACYRELERSCSTSGFFPYRLGILSMKSTTGATTNEAKFQRLLKQAIDPHRILAPGRYEST